MATPLDFARALLTRLGLPDTQNRLVSIVAFVGTEMGNWAANRRGSKNPLNTRLSYGGTLPPGSIQIYPNWTAGIEATARTIGQPNMRSILDALRADAAPENFMRAIDQSQWNTEGHYGDKDPYALYRNVANMQDDGGSIDTAAVSGMSYIGVAVASAVILGSAGALAYYVHTHRSSTARGFALNPADLDAGSPSKVQSLLFPRSTFTPRQAIRWADKYGFVSTWMDFTRDYIRLRQRDPKGLSRLRTVNFGPRVKAVIGWA